MLNQLCVDAYSLPTAVIIGIVVAVVLVVIIVSIIIFFAVRAYLKSMKPGPSSQQEQRALKC